MQNAETTYQIVWFTKNLRVYDNTVLYEALRLNKPVIGVYCFDPRQFIITKYGFKKTEKYRVKFLIESVKNLKENLEQLNIPLFVYHNKPEHILPKLVEKYKSTAIHFQKEFTIEENNIVKAIKAKLCEKSKLIACFDQYLFHPDDIKLKASQIPQVFTNFRKHLEKHCKVRPALNIAAQKKINTKNTTAIPDLNKLGYKDFKAHPNSAFSFSGGESNAIKRLDEYLFKTKKIGVYKKTRNGLIGSDCSSKFSPWLALGCISARSIYWAIKRFEKSFFSNQSTYWLVFELLWRDYFKYMALKHGNSIFKRQGILNKIYSWRVDPVSLNNWINGKTNEPFVNANMIELKKTGWMSNRGRQNVVSYFSKTLEIDWRIGAAYFESLLIDYDVHSNYGNWMYVSGVGNDPRNRTFNIRQQAERYDSNGKFQTLWLQDTLF